MLETGILPETTGSEGIKQFTNCQITLQVPNTIYQFCGTYAS